MAFLVMGIVPLLIPGLGLAGVKSIGYSITRIAGPYYFIIQLAILIPLLASFVAAGYFSWNSKQYFIKRKSQILLIACFPIFVSACIILILMQVGVNINASVIGSLMITITLLILVYTEHKEKQYQFMSYIPYTRENQFIKSLTELISDPEVGLEVGRLVVEREMIKEALAITDGDKSKAAKVLGISRQTLQRRLSKVE